MKKLYTIISLLGACLVYPPKNFAMDSLEYHPRDLINFFEERQEYLKQTSNQPSQDKNKLFEPIDYNYDYETQESYCTRAQLSQDFRKLTFLAKSFCALYLGLFFSIFYNNLAHSQVVKIKN
jgi:hypothetical protein